jgi:hypothetical protein
MSTLFLFLWHINYTKSAQKVKKKKKEKAVGVYGQSLGKALVMKFVALNLIKLRALVSLPRCARDDILLSINVVRFTRPRGKRCQHKIEYCF